MIVNIFVKIRKSRNYAKNPCPRKWISLDHVQNEVCICILSMCTNASQSVNSYRSPKVFHRFQRMFCISCISYLSINTRNRRFFTVCVFGSKNKESSGSECFLNFLLDSRAYNKHIGMFKRISAPDNFLFLTWGNVYEDTYFHDNVKIVIFCKYPCPRNWVSFDHVRNKTCSFIFHMRTNVYQSFNSYRSLMCMISLSEVCWNYGFSAPTEFRQIHRKSYIPAKIDFL